MRRLAQRVRLTAEVLGAYVRARALMSRQQLPVMLERLRPRTGGSHGTEDVAEAARLGSIVTRVLTPLPMDSRCLVRALTLSRLLDRRGIAARLVIGVKPGERLTAHAWVEVAGRPVLPAGDFERLTEL